MMALGIRPVFPPSEDFHVGDVIAFDDLKPNEKISAPINPFGLAAIEINQRVERPRCQAFMDRGDCCLSLSARTEVENCDVTCLTLAEPDSQLFGGGEGSSCARDIPLSH